MRKTYSYRQSFDRVPPILCRLLARRGNTSANRPTTVSELSVESELSRRRIIQLSNKLDWSGMSLDEIEDFSRACGVNLMRPLTHLRDWQRIKKDYLKNAHPKQRAALARMMREIVKSKG